MQLPPKLVLTAVLLAVVPARADITIACGGYNPAINDHVEWDITIASNKADFSGKHFSVSETKRFFTLVAPDAQIRINKTRKSYMMWGSKGMKAPATEWSRKIPGEGCEIPKIGTQP